MKIYHTADVHIGLKFGSYPDTVRATLVNERFAVLERMVQNANAEDCDVFVVAGDLFDHVKVTEKEVRRAVDILATFTGEAVLVLAGNHDYCRDSSGKPWSWFINHASSTSVIPLLHDQVVPITVHGRTTHFYACPCPDRTSKDHRIGWVGGVEKDSSSLHVGIAHGNVVGYALDDNHAYYSMTVEELQSAGVHTWLLGHIHVPYPRMGTIGNPTFFMPGAPTPDSVRMSHSGSAWIIAFDERGDIAFHQERPAAITFKRFDVQLSSGVDLQRLQLDVQQLPLTSTILDLQLSGALEEHDLQALGAWIDSLQSLTLHVTSDTSAMKKRLTSDAIAALYPTGTLQERVLQMLLADTDNPDDVHLAYEILQGGAR